MLETRGLTRLFGDQLAVDDVDLTVRPGGLTGFVGGNGAGKTTTMRMIMGILEPTAGDILWRGRPAGWGERGPVRVQARGARPLPEAAGAVPAGLPRPAPRNDRGGGPSVGGGAPRA